MRRILHLLPVSGSLLAGLLLCYPAEPVATGAEQPAEHKSYTETIPGSSIQFDMVAIPGGTYPNGSAIDAAISVVMVEARIVKSPSLSQGFDRLGLAPLIVPRK